MGADDIIVRFVVPGIPKPKLRARSRIVRSRDGRQFVSNYTPASTRSNEAVIRSLAADAMDGMPPVDGPVQVRISILMPIPSSWSKRRQQLALEGIVRPTGKPDLDNIAKSVCDPLNGICYRDDSQIVAAHIWKFYDAAPRLVVEVHRLISLPKPVSQAVENSSAQKNLITEAEI